MNRPTFTLMDPMPIIVLAATLAAVAMDNHPLEINGCSITYYDENLQPIPNFNWTAANQLTYNNSRLTIGIECQFITAEQLHEQFNLLRPFNYEVVTLVVKNSNLTTLSNLPQGLNAITKLSISNTSIDLGVLKEASEYLSHLTTLEITNEKISNIPQNFFQGMPSLKELRLENDEIASLDGDAFHNLDDSLEILDLRRNRFNRFPMAVKNLAQLAVLDLSDNDIVIDTQENDLPEKLEPLLNLRELNMNRINCTCEFSSSPFFEWITRTHISGVRCFAPDKLRYQEVIVFERDEFCSQTSSASSVSMASLLIIILCQTIQLSLHILIRPRVIEL